MNDKLQKVLLAVILIGVIIALVVVAGECKKASETGVAPDINAIVTDNFNPNGIFTPPDPVTAPAENIFATNVPPETLKPAETIVAKEGDVIDFGEMTFIADYNGTLKEVNGWDITFSANASQPLHAGKNTIIMAYRDNAYSFTIEIGDSDDKSSVFDSTTEKAETTTVDETEKVESETTED